MIGQTPKKACRTVPVNTDGATAVHGGGVVCPDHAPGHEDMLWVDVGAYVVDIGWYGGGGPDGHYGVTIYRDSWDDQIGNFCTRDVAEAVRFAEWWIGRLVAGEKPEVPA